MSGEIWNKILQSAIAAPSGDNCQPWLFRIFGDSLELRNDPSRDQSVYNFRQQAAFIAQGALLENIRLSAAHEGYDIDTRLFPDSADQNLVAKIVLSGNSKLGAQESFSRLYHAIPLRHTNRKPYKDIPLTTHQKQVIVSAGNSTPPVHFSIVDDKAAIEKLAKLASVNERIVLENKFLHCFLFNHIVWTKEQMETKRRGMFVKTLEMQKPAELIFKLASNWPRLKLLNLFGLSKKVSSENYKVYRQSGAIGLLSTPEYTSENQVLVGEALQKIWLSSTSIGLNLHPLSGIIFLHQKNILDPNSHELHDKHKSMVEETVRSIETIFNLHGSMPCFMFRLGVADPPSARSLYQPLDNLLIKA